MIIRSRTIAALVLSLVVAGCASMPSAEKLLEPITGEKDVKLPGTREPVLPTSGPQLKSADATDPIVIPAAVANASWSQPGGVPSNALGNLAAGSPLKRAWAVGAGTGSSGRDRLISPPIIVGGRVFVLDAEANLSAFDASTGAVVWRRSVAREGKDAEGAFGGGIASENGVLYVATGFGEVMAVDPAQGGEVWRRRLDTPIRAAPTVADGRMYVITVSNEVVAISTVGGDVLWRHDGSGEQASLLSASSPAVSGGMVVVPFTTGEIAALDQDHGSLLWSDSLASSDPTNSLANLNDVAGRPVIDGSTVFAIAHSGRLSAMELKDGHEVWSQEFSGTQTPWVAGDYVFIVSGRSTLVAVSKRTGGVRWSVELPAGASYAGPVVAGGRLLVVSSAGALLEVSPQTGQVMNTVTLGSPVYLAPVIANGTVFVLADDGNLVALR
ncbi:MAG: PQQ-binding-like beta-propeller repeat protein [Hyphomicrobiales bacterium]